jgi:hypothetical protein
MPDHEIPPPSSTLERYRAEVGRRSELIGRRRQQRSLGVAGVVAVLAVGLFAAVHLAGNQDHVSASGVSAAGSPRSPGTTVTHGSIAGSADATSSASSGKVSAGVPSPQNASASAPEFSPALSANGPAYHVVYARSSGFVAIEGPSMDVQLVLELPAGDWGPAAITSGAGTVASVVAQARVGGDLRVDIRTLAGGTARLDVPSIGHPADSWHGTIIVHASRPSR